jgi:large subunit ribosomal protein L5
MTSFSHVSQVAVPRDLLLKLKVKTIAELPTFSKITLHTSTTQAINQSTHILSPFLTLMLISGQTPQLTRAKKPVAAFRLRKDSLLGCKVTLRGQRMLSMLEMLSQVVLPRLRDFSGFTPKSVNVQGKFSYGLSTTLIFQELEALYDVVDLSSGVELSLHCDSSSPMYAQLLISAFQFPFHS